MKQSISYSDAGVDIDAATRATDRIKELARTTFNERTLSEIGSFGGMFDGAFPGLKQPVLVASADGVGTKLKIAFMTGVNDTVGRDLVNHCVNDILVQGARPLFFLDYIATGNLSRKLLPLSLPVSRMAVVKTAVFCLAAKLRRCRTFIPRVNTMSRDLLLAWPTARELLTAKASSRAMCSWRFLQSGFIPMVIRWRVNCFLKLPV